MQLSNISQFLEIYKKKLSLEDDKREVILKIIQEEIGIQLTEKALIIVKGVVSIKATQVIKNEIFLHKVAILKKIHEQGRKDIHDIQ